MSTHRSTRPPEGGYGHGDRSSQPPSVSLGTRLATLVGVAAMASLVASVPAALRIASAEPASSGFRVWIALAGGAIVPTVAMVALMRGARGGLRAFGGEGSSGRTFGFGLWLVTTFAVLVGYGALLRATTHHHALAGVTFALGALVIVASLALLIGRFVVIAQRRPPAIRAGLFAVATFVVTFALIGAGVPVARAILPATGALLLDLLAFSIAAAFASRATFEGRQVLALLGPPMAACVLAFGLTALRTTPALGTTIRDRAPLFASAVSLTRH